VNDQYSQQAAGASRTGNHVRVNAGFVGLGMMGRGMAHCLIRAGHNVVVYNRSADRIPELVAAGARGADSAQALASACDLVFLCLADAAAVEQVMFGPHGLAEGLRPGSTVIDTGTIAAGAARSCAVRLAERGVAYLDAPVSGGVQAAAEGRLSAMVGGDAQVLAQCEPVMAAFASRIVHVGDVGAGQVCKACNQIAVSSIMMGVAEAFVLARKHGIDPARVREALLGGAARSQVLENNAQRLLTRNFQPGFRAVLMRKDLRLALEAAQQAGASLPGSALVLQMLESVCQLDGMDLDWSVLGRQMERLSGLDLTD